MFKIKQEEFQNWAQYKRKIELVYSMVAALPLLGFVLSYLYWNNPKAVLPVPVDVPVFIQYAILLVFVVGVVYSYKSFRKNMRTLSRSKVLKEQLVNYFTFNLKLYSAIGVGAFVCVLLYMFTGVGVFAAAYCFYLLMISMEAPSLQRVGRQLCLNKDKINSLYKGDAI